LFRKRISFRGNKVSTVTEKIKIILRENVELQIEMIENKIRCLDIQKKFYQNILEKRREER